MMDPNGFRAILQTPAENGAVRCSLCPRRCLIPEGARGFCAVRRNTGGVLYSEAYGHPAAIQNDPIEKKPLYHYMPGSRTFSIGTFGCNLNCLFCQNDFLSRGSYESPARQPFYEPAVLADAAVRAGCKSVAFTYNEPGVWAEYVMDIAHEAKKRGLGTVLVSNGYITPEAAAELYPCIDAANIDMKGFSEAFYRSLCGGSLAPVLHACEYFRNVRGGHLELTNLVIPGQNDGQEMIAAFLDWAEEKLGLDTVLHFSAYFPAYKYHESPPTPPETLYRIRDFARGRGFRFVYLGNIR